MIHQDIARAICEVPYGMSDKISLVLTEKMCDLLMPDLSKIIIDRKLMTYYCGVPIKVIEGKEYRWFISIADGEVNHDYIKTV